MAKDKQLSEAAAMLGHAGGVARSKVLTAKQRKAISKKAITARNQNLSPAERSKLAKKAARARWSSSTTDNKEER